MASDFRTNDKRTSDAVNLIPLLCRALSRLAVAAHGIDPRLDQLLAELRQQLRRDIDDPRRLAELIDTIDARIKHVDDEREQHGEVLQESLQKLIEQLLTLKPASDIAKELKGVLKQLKKELPDGDRRRLLTRLPVLHGRVLDGIDGAVARGGLFARWRSRTRAGEAAPAISMVTAAALDVERAPVAAAIPELSTIALTDAPAADLAEPPFARISSAVCEVLEQLLKQIEPPPAAGDNYRHARELIANGLNWYELVSALEEISIVVLAAIERGQGEFQQFLQGINQRLEDAHSVLASSRVSQGQRAQADAELNDAVRSQVAEMQHSVQHATRLDDLKQQIGARLDGVVGALDRHKASEQLRQRELEQQLGALTERLREMETQAGAIERRLLEQQRLALLDTLTQLPNRQAYEQRLQQEYERWCRYGRPLAIAVCDIDHFKSINDSFGHLAGDKVLRIISKTLTKRLRKTDFIARFGGEEFVILMPETDAAAALQTIESIREAVAQCPFHFREKPLAITMSAGIANFVEHSSPEKIFELADTALYQAKQNGRNRCVVAA